MEIKYIDGFASKPHNSLLPETNFSHYCTVTITMTCHSHLILFHKYVIFLNQRNRKQLLTTKHIKMRRHLGRYNTYGPTNIMD